MLRAGLFGFPSSGKTALFQLLTSAREAPRAGGKAEANVGVSRVPDERLDRLTALFNPRKHVPATVEFADIAGAGGAQTGAAGAARRRAVPQRRRAAARRADVPRPVGAAPGRHDRSGARRPRRWRTRSSSRTSASSSAGWSGSSAISRKATRRRARKEQEILRALPDRARRRHSRCARSACRPRTRKRLRGFQFLSAKPLLLVLNLDEADLPQADDAVALAGLEIVHVGAATRAVPICAKIELEIAQLDPADAAAFMADLGLRESGLDRVIRASYDLLGYISFFTVGEDECRAWSIPREHPAVLAAGEIHSDISRGFIRAEVVALRAPARARLAGRLPRPRRAAARGQGVHRPRRRRHQLPARHVEFTFHREDDRRLRGAGAVRARRRRGARARAGAGARERAATRPSS